MNIVKEDLRDCAASGDLLHPGSQLWMHAHVHVTYWYFQAPEGGHRLHTVWAALDRVNSYTAQSTALKLPHLHQQRQENIEFEFLSSARSNQNLTRKQPAKDQVFVFQSELLCSFTILKQSKVENKMT